jgi:hypothetical protein
MREWTLDRMAIGCVTPRSFIRECLAIKEKWHLTDYLTGRVIADRSDESVTSELDIWRAANLFIQRYRMRE